MIGGPIMEAKNKPVDTSKAPKKSGAIYVSISREAHRKLKKDLDFANKKTFGEKIKMSDIVQLGISLVAESHLATLQKASMTNTDRLEMLRAEHIKEHGPISADDFIGLLLASRFEKPGT